MRNKRNIYGVKEQKERDGIFYSFFLLYEHEWNHNLNTSFRKTDSEG